MSAVPGSPYDTLSYRDVQAECKKRGIKAVGKKDQLSRALDDFDKSPLKAATPTKGRPRPAISSTLRTTLTYPPPSPPFSEEDDDSASEPPSPQQPSSPANTPKRTSHADVPSPLPRYPVSATHYVPTDHSSTEEVVPGWMKQAAFGMVLLALYLMIAYGSQNESPFRAHSIDTIRNALSEYPAGERIAQELSTHQRVTLVGPIEKGRDIAKKIAALLHPHNATTALVLKEPSSAVLVEKIANKLSKNPESVIVINTDVIDRENAHVLNTLFDDTLPTLETSDHKKVPLSHAVFILLADLAHGENAALTHESVATALREKWDDRVAQRIHPFVIL